jgi:hypothetical protein
MNELNRFDGFESALVLMVLKILTCFLFLIFCIAVAWWVLWHWILRHYSIFQDLMNELPWIKPPMKRPTDPRRCPQGCCEICGVKLTVENCRLIRTQIGPHCWSVFWETRCTTCKPFQSLAENKNSCSA